MISINNTGTTYFAFLSIDTLDCYIGGDSDAGLNVTGGKDDITAIIPVDSVYQVSGSGFAVHRWSELK